MGGAGVRVLATLAATVLAGCSASPPPTPSAPSASSAASATSAPEPSAPAVPFRCSTPALAALPEWARDGFSPPDQPVAHFRSVDGHIVAVPFGWPLREKQPEGRANKVLWIADHSEAGPMTIDARRESDAVPVHRELANGPGPSIIDLPGKGCWQLDLSWPGGNDRIYLRYLAAAD